jgi:hypothetical protein
VTVGVPVVPAPARHIQQGTYTQGALVA